MQALVQAAMTRPPSAPFGALVLTFIVADLDCQLAHEASLVRQVPNSEIRLAIRREMLAVYVALMIMTAYDALPEDLSAELAKKLRLCLDHFGSYAPESPMPESQTEEARKAAAYRAIVGLTQIEPAAREFGGTIPQGDETVFKWGAAATGTSHLSNRLMQYTTLASDEPGSRVLRMLEKSAALVSEPHAIDVLAKYAVHAADATRHLTPWFTARR
jgi:hypothetical protein